jgi:carbonic anhydrase
MTQQVRSQTEALLLNARRYQRDEFRTGAPRIPRTAVAVITCMDARINVYGLLGLSEGDCHIVRNAGGVVTEDVIRSLTISQRLLRTREILIIMHAACGLAEVTDEEFMQDVQRDVGLRPTWRPMTFLDPCIELRQGLARLRNCPFLPNQNGIRAFLFDERTAGLAEVH